MVGVLQDHRWAGCALLVVAYLAAGYWAGRWGRRLLGRLTRGVALRPPWCELATGVLWALVAWRAAVGGMPPGWLPVPLALAWFGVLLAATDLVCRRLPNALTLPAYPVLAALLGVAAWYGPGTALGLRAVGGALLFGGAHAVVHLLAPRSLGAGDVKLAGVLGAVLAAVSWPALALGALLAALCTAGYAAVRALRRHGLGYRAGRPGGRTLTARDPTLPHGPGMLAAAWLVTLGASTPPPLPGL